MTGTETHPSEMPSLAENPALQGAVLAGLYACSAWILLGGGTNEPVLLSATLVLGATLVALSVIDLQSFRLPDVLTLPLAAAGIVLSALTGGPVLWHLVSAAIGFGVLLGISLGYRRLRGRDGLGLGDAKLLAASGAWLGAEALPTVVLLAASVALAIIGALRLTGRSLGLSDAIPFGPFLAFGTWLVWLNGTN